MPEDILRTKLVDMMFKVSRLMKREMSFTDNNLVHLSILQIQTLIYLKNNKGASMGDIAEYFRVELSSATSLLNKLYDQKLVERNTDKEDRRLVRITLTTAGELMFKQAMQERRKKIETTLGYLSKKEQSDLLNILEALNNKLQK